MKLINNKINLLLISTGLLVGCTTTDRVFLVTKTNFGLDIDNKPPTAGINISRTEVGIQPIYPKGILATCNQNVSSLILEDKPVGKNDTTNTKETNAVSCQQKEVSTAVDPKNNSEKAGSTNEDSVSQELGLPLLAAFGLQGSILNPHITGYFAGGEAAYYLAGGGLKNAGNNEVCLQTKPEDSRNFIARILESKDDYEKKQRNFYFATDTSYGLKVAWSGTAGPYPDSLKVGYNRKEFASPPIFTNPGCKNKQDGWSVNLPSFYAVIDNSSGWGEKENLIDNVKDVFNPWSAKLNHVQFFATGSAANEFAKREEVQEVAFQNMAPSAAALTTLEINQDSLKAIESSLKKSADNVPLILEKAKKLGLFKTDDNLSKEEILAALTKKIIENNYFTTSKLCALKKQLP